MSTHRFSSIREVFLHILTIHLADFRVEYAATTVRFALCKLCNGFINLEEEGDEEGVVNRCANLLPAVLRIRIRIHRIHMFLGLPDPDPLVRGMDPDSDPALDPDPSIIMQK